MKTRTSKADPRIRQASRDGFRDGVASVYMLGTPRKPAPARVYRHIGSLAADTHELARDTQRLFQNGTAQR
jgi:hypothetical protein